MCVCVCVRARASLRARGCGGCLHLESQPITALNQEGQALPGLVEVQPVRCLCLVGRAASLVRSRRGWVLGEHSPWKPGWGGGGRHPPHKQPSQMWSQCVGWGCSGWTPNLGSRRQSPPCRDTCRAGRPRGRGHGGTPEPGLGSRSPQCFTMNPCELMVLPMQQATY